MKSNFFSSSSILKKFLIFNLIVFLFLGSFTFLYLEAIKPNIFTNGGDRTIEEIPESIVCKKYGIEILDGLGKKIRSSSDLTGLKSI